MTLSVSECLSFFPYQLDKLHEVDDGKSVSCFLTDITYVTQFLPKCAAYQSLEADYEYSSELHLAQTYLQTQ